MSGAGGCRKRDCAGSVFGCSDNIELGWMEVVDVLDHLRHASRQRAGLPSPHRAPGVAHGAMLTNLRGSPVSRPSWSCPDPGIELAHAANSAHASMNACSLVALTLQTPRRDQLCHRVYLHRLLLLGVTVGRPRSLGVPCPGMSRWVPARRVDRPVAPSKAARRACSGRVRLRNARSRLAPHLPPRPHFRRPCQPWPARLNC